MTEFKKEDRYLVVKRKDMLKTLSEYELVDLLYLAERVQFRTQKTLQCVVVESDWPEYDTVWAMIEARCTGKKTELELLREENAKLRLRLQEKHLVRADRPATPIRLHPCPNCGNSADITFNCYELHPHDADNPLYEAGVQCLDCDLQTGSSVNTTGPHDTMQEALQAAADIWNDFAERNGNAKTWADGTHIYVERVATK